MEKGVGRTEAGGWMGDKRIERGEVRWRESRQAREKRRRDEEGWWAMEIEEEEQYRWNVTVTKLRFSRWKFAAILFRTRDASTSSLSAAMNEWVNRTGGPNYSFKAGLHIYCLLININIFVYFSRCTNASIFMARYRLCDWLIDYWTFLGIGLLYWHEVLTIL